MSERKPPHLHLEQARLGQRHVDDVDAVAALAADDAAFLAAMPPKNAAATIAAIASQRTSSSSSLSASWRRVVAVVVPTLATAAIAFAVLTPSTAADDGRVVGSDDVRPKGGAPQLLVQRVGADGAQLVQDGDLVAAGDVLQLGWVAARSSSTSVRGVVVSIDGRGAVTRHLPLEAAAPAATIGGSSLLPSSYELDDAPRFERFFLVTGSDVDVDAVVAAAERLAHADTAATASLQLPARWNVSAVSVRK